MKYKPLLAEGSTGVQKSLVKLSKASFGISPAIIAEMISSVELLTRLNSRPEHYDRDQYYKKIALKLWQDFDTLCEMLGEFLSGHICACY